MGGGLTVERRLKCRVGVVMGHDLSVSWMLPFPPFFFLFLILTF